MPLLPTVPGLVLALLLLAILAFRFWKRSRELTRRFSAVLDVEKERDRIAEEKRKLRREVDQQRTRWKAEFETTVEQLERLTNELDRVQDAVEMQSFGLYEPEFDFDTSDQYKDALRAVRDSQKEMIRDKTAAVCDTEWQVEGSKVKGRQMTNRQLRLQLRAFNGEASAAIAKVRYNNVEAVDERINKAFDAINKLGETQSCSITPGYLRLKIEELHLAHELEEKKQAEKEEQQAIREQMREEARAEKELEKATLDAEKEEARYNEALEKARIEIAEAEGAKQEKLAARISELERRLAEAHDNAERAKSRAQLTKSGHVYVISNLGSFGEGTYKIGMTRRLDPLDRVRELGDASVPFPFDVHAMIFTKDAPGLESLLQRRFADQRLNLVNLRREFFSVTLEEIATVVHEQDATIHITMAAEAQQFRQSEVIRQARVESEGPTREERIVSDAKQQLEALQAEWNSVDLSTPDGQATE